MFVATKVSLSQQNIILCRDKIVTDVCRYKSFVAAKIFCRYKSFVTTSILLSRQKQCFVATKMILVAAPANGREVSLVVWSLCGEILERLICRDGFCCITV